jgi:hypothetical protein
MPQVVTEGLQISRVAANTMQKPVADGQQGAFFQPAGWTVMSFHHEKSWHLKDVERDQGCLTYAKRTIWHYEE